MVRSLNIKNGNNGRLWNSVFSNETSSMFSRILEIIDGGKKINHVFGEGTSPRFRMISRGLKAIGIRADAF